MKLIGPTGHHPFAPTAWYRFISRQSHAPQVRSNHTEASTYGHYPCH